MLRKNPHRGLELPATSLHAQAHVGGESWMSSSQLDSPAAERDPWGPDLALGQMPPSPLGCPPAVLGQRCTCWGEAERLLSACSPYCGEGPARLGGGRETETKCHHLKPHHRGRETERWPCKAASGISGSPVPGGIKGLYGEHGT